MIEVNGKKVEWEKNETVSELLGRMNYIFPLVVVRINGQLVFRKNYSDTIIPDNSKISVIHMISGG